MSKRQHVLRQLHENLTHNTPRFEDHPSPDRWERGHTVHAAALMKTVIGQLEVSASLAERVAQALADTVDDTFRSHCRVAGVAGGTLTIHVDSVTRVYAMRMTWVLVIRERLLRETAIGPIRRVVFQQGVDGVGIGPAIE